MAEIQFNSHYRAPKGSNPEKVLTTLQRLYNKSKCLDRDQVLKEARKKQSPLHDHFEWDDSIAGVKWRKQQANKLIRAVVFVSGGITQHAFTLTTVTINEEETKNVYVSTKELTDDSKLLLNAKLLVKAKISGLRNALAELNRIDGSSVDGKFLGFLDDLDELVA